MVETPLYKIKKKLSKNIPTNLIDKIPNRWEKIGDIVIIKLDDDLKKYSDIVGEIYGDFLDCKTVLNDVGGISGELREPNVKVIYGTNNTETAHKENKVRFKLDPQKVMFSSGNMDERLRMAKISSKDEVVVDLFAGIGYFTLPMAVHSTPKKIFACEKNKIAFDYLSKNIALNNVNSIVEPLFGDNRKIAPKNIADRVIMGYIGGTKDFLPIAIKSLNEGKGIIHFHEKYSDKIMPNKPLKTIEKKANKINRKIKLIQYKKVKSYAPGISHFVFDLSVGEQ
jgi:tRNA wybutosine-synthesizing protein 2